MDDASSELLRYLGTQLPMRPWLACTTRRPGDGGFAAAEGNPPLPALTLRLEPLPAEEAKALVQAAAGERRLSDDELEAIAQRGGGNPLFLQELASPEEAEQVEELPETVESLVATRIDRLAPADRALLRWASVFGVSFSWLPDRRCARRRLDRRRRLRGLGPAGGVRRARPGGRRRLPLPPRPDPRRRLRGALVQASARAPRPRRRGDRASPGAARRRGRSCSRCTSSAPSDGWRRGDTPSRRGTGRTRSTRTSRRRSSSSGRSSRRSAAAMCRRRSSRRSGRSSETCACAWATTRGRARRTARHGARSRENRSSTPASSRRKRSCRCASGATRRRCAG